MDQFRIHDCLYFIVNVIIYSFINTLCHMYGYIIWVGDFTTWIIFNNAGAFDNKTIMMYMKYNVQSFAFKLTALRSTFLYISIGFSLATVAFYMRKTVRIRATMGEKMLTNPQYSNYIVDTFVFTIMSGYDSLKILSNNGQNNY
jgi:hypothetical protein